MGNFTDFMADLCCVDTNDILENHNKYNDSVSDTPNYVDFHDIKNTTDTNNNFIHLNSPTSLDSLPSNKIAFTYKKYNSRSQITSLSKLPISTKNVVPRQICNPFNYYNIIENKGSGSFGTVFKVVHKITGEVRAMKVIPKNNLKFGFSDDDINKEVNILKSLVHPNIIKLYEFYMFMGNYYLINEYCTDGDLANKLDELQVFPEFFVKILMIQIFRAVQFLNDNGIMHGDLKLENIMIDSYLKKDDKSSDNDINFVKSILEDEKEINEISEYMKKKYKKFSNKTFNMNNDDYGFYPKNLRNNVENLNLKNNEEFGCSIKNYKTFMFNKKNADIIINKENDNSIENKEINSSLIANNDESSEIGDNGSKISVPFIEKEKEEENEFNHRNFVNQINEVDDTELKITGKINKMKLKNFELKIIDFGCSKIFNKYKKSFEDIIGSLAYCSPEVLKNNYNEKCDVWSCGVIMYLLLSGTFPFYGKNEEEITKKILSGKFEFPNKYFYNVSPEAKDLIKRCLEYDKNKRISARAALKHEFFACGLDINNIFDDKIEIKPILNNLQNFSSKTKFYQAVLAYLSHNFADKKELKKLKQIFYKIDLDLDAKISKEELYMAYKKAGLNLSKEELNKIISSIDFNNNGTIEYEEFIRAVLPKDKLFTDANLKTAFNMFDIDKNGGISINEIKEILGTGKIFDKNANDELLKEIKNKGNDKEISFEEFKDLLRNV